MGYRDKQSVGAHLGAPPQGVVSGREEICDRRTKRVPSNWLQGYLAL